MGVCAFSACTRPRLCTELADLGDFALPEKSGERKCGFITRPDGEKALQGPFEILDLDGKPVVRGQFFDGKKTGRWTTLDAQGKIKSERDFGVPQPLQSGLPANTRGS